MAVHIEFRARATHRAAERAAEHSSVLDPSQGLAGWLGERLRDTGMDVAAPKRHDWGYEIQIRAKGGEYYAGLPSRKDPTSNWHVFVEKRMSIRDRVRGRIMPVSEPMAMLIQEIISREPRYKVVRVEERH